LQSHAFTIGTRGSPLALAQAHQVRDAICDVHGLESDAVEIRTISTTGDRIADKALREFGGKGLFTKEIEEALLSGEIDAAVHSMKDMPTELPPGLEIACFLPREDVRDAFISSKAADLSGLKKGAVLGTASLRRQAQIKRARPDLEVVTFRGNVQTRLRKLADDEADATLLANAGLRRLGLESHIAALMEPEVMLPAVAQGAIGIEIRTGDEQTANLLKPLNHEPTQACIAAERAFLARLDGSCRTPIAGLAELDGNQMRFRGQILRPDGSESHETSREGDARNGEAMARDAAEELLGRAGDGFFEDPD
jgi:hydroxymethylbilane synthase